MLDGGHLERLRRDSESPKLKNKAKIIFSNAIFGQKKTSTKFGAKLTRSFLIQKSFNREDLDLTGKSNCDKNFFVPKNLQLWSEIVEPSGIFFPSVDESFLSNG